MQAFQSTKQRYATLYNVMQRYTTLCNVTQRYLPLRLLLRLSPTITPSNPPLYSDHQNTKIPKRFFVGPSTKVPKPK